MPPSGLLTDPIALSEEWIVIVAFAGTFQLRRFEVRLSGVCMLPSSPKWRATQICFEFTRKPGCLVLWVFGGIKVPWAVPDCAFLHVVGTNVQVRRPILGQLEAFPLIAVRLGITPPDDALY